MNAFGYFFHRIGSKLGILSERHRWGAINRETQILSEAEDLLGRLAWPDVKDIDDLSGEYWQIRDLDQQQEMLCQASLAADERNEQLRESLYDIEDAAEARLKGLRELKSKRMEEALGLMREIDQLKDWKEETKKKYTNLKSKIELMRRLGQNDEDISSEVVKTEAAMARLKEEFTGDLGDINAKTTAIETLENEIAGIEAELNESKSKVKEETAELTAEVGRLSKQIAELSAKIGALENAKSNFYFTVGHYLSNRLESRSPDIVAVLRKHRPLISRIFYYRRSIALNQQLTRQDKSR